MDCEKFDQIIIDAVYDELDELTLAAAKRHADGCQHCQTALSGLRATRKIGLLPLVEAPAGLEAHVLQAARDAHRTLPWPKRVGRAISWAGSYAMRPQMAMAALLLLMLGSSLIFVRANPDRSGALSRVNVIERGVPGQSVDEPRLDKPGRQEERPAAGARSARRDDDRGVGSLSAPTPAATTAAAADPGRIAEGETFGSKGGGSKAETDMMPRSKSAPAAAPAPADEIALGGAADRATASSEKKRDQQGPAALGGFATPPAGQAQDAFAAAIDLFNTGRFAEAEKAFDDIAATDSKDAARAQLYAAKAADRGFGCSKALPKYEQVYARYGSSATGPDGLMGAADCYAKLGNYDQALASYNRLRSIAGYRATAEDKINYLPMLRQQQQQQVAAKRPAPAKAAVPSAAAKPKSSTSTDVMK